MTNQLPINQRPNYVSVELKPALSRDWNGWHLSEKMDGVWSMREMSGCIVTGETMRDGRFFAFDIVQAFGEDIRRRPWIERGSALDELLSRLDPDLNWHHCATGTGTEFIEAILDAGGEGIVAKPWHSPFGATWFKVKRSETYDCTVAEMDQSRGSIRLALSGTDCGWMAAHASFDQIRIGDIVEITAYGRHPSGKFREARLRRIRWDKIASFPT